MENKVDWKVGDRVLFQSAILGNEEGTVTRVEYNRIWVKWDNDGEVLHFDPMNRNYSKMNSEPLYESAELQAVKLLLSLGYTLKKGV
jgi:hypothetical protein